MFRPLEFRSQNISARLQIGERNAIFLYTAIAIGYVFLESLTDNSVKYPIKGLNS